VKSNRPNRQCSLLSTTRSVVIGTVVLAGSLLGLSGGSQCRAANVILSNGNSSVTIDPTASAGLDNWTISGQNQLNQQSFWYRIGNTGAQSSINTLGAPSVSLYDTTGDGLDDTAILTYGPSSGLQITVTYRLSGGQSGTYKSDLGETIQIANTGKSTQLFNFFDYANFNLDDLLTGQTAAISGSNTATVTGNGVTEQTTVSPSAADYDASNYSTLLTNLTTKTDFTLPNVATSGPGDEETGFEWSQSIMGGCSYEISSDQIISGSPTRVVPEPIGAAMAATALSGLLLVRPRRSTHS
jgi:hypothetical protein